jgi:Xaa-Pro aminopeptidase
MSSAHTSVSPNASTVSGVPAATKLAALRGILAREGVNGFIQPREDEYQNEYPPIWAERLAWLTGFTGSAGVGVILADKAVVMSDGRYQIQLRSQVDPLLYAVDDSTKIHPGEWLKREAPSGSVIGYDPKLVTPSQLYWFEDKLKGSGITLKALAANPVDEIWTENRPDLPQGKAELFPVSYAGKDSADKRVMIGDKIKELNADASLITAQDSIAWLLNVRGSDVPHTPLILSHMILHADGRADWFVPTAKIGPEVAQALGNTVTIKAPDELEGALKELSGKKVLFDGQRSSVWLQNTLVDAGVELIEQKDLCVWPKACKGEAEIKAMHAAHLRDGVAMVRFLHWLEGALHGGLPITEISAGDTLREYRAAAAEFRDTSFDSIVGFNAHGAIIHYRAENDPANAAAIKGDGMLLIDSGAQYTDGTTDITRTIRVGQASDEMRTAYTAVLKGHIALATAQFPQGTTGTQLDALVRAPLWALGLDYPHGTGHGVGCFLSVHEEAASISPRGTEKVLPGMIISNEPGFYKEGAFGIRIENLILCRDTGDKMADGRARLVFDTLTLCPIDTSLIDVAMLSPAEKDWLNAYHRRVYDALAPHLAAEVKTWLSEATDALV